MDAYQVLVVDDDAVQREMLRDMLSACGAPACTVLEAQDGQEALALLRRNLVDAVLLDKRMPIMDGDTVCKHIREIPGMNLLPVIMVTGSNSSEELAKSFAMGATDFIRKPYSPMELLARVKAAVANKRVTDQLDTAENLLFALARMVEAKDETTGDHCSRLSHMALVFGRILGLSDSDLHALRRGGVLHDIGKLGIPDSLLLKRGPLSDQEWALMRTHTLIGGHLCEGLSSMRKVQPIIVHHHERWDGSGYPDGLAGEQIPYLARVFQILDIYDALASERPYKAAFSTEEIIAMFEEETRNGWRDPALVSIFLDLLRTDPERLRMPQQRTRSSDERIFQRIAATGVMDWDRKNATGSKT
jgi:putative two-component system response regulator